MVRDGLCMSRGKEMRMKEERSSADRLVMVSAFTEWSNLQVIAAAFSASAHWAADGGRAEG